MQDEHRARLLANELHIERRWGQPCRAFNLCARIRPATVSALSGLQERILGAGSSPLSSSLLRVPERAMHISVAWLVPVHLGIPAEQKDELWREHGRRWQSVIAAEVRSAGRLSLRYQDAVATDSAIVALAWPADEVNTLRRNLRRRLDIAAEISAGNMVHSTLFRYMKPFGDPGGLLKLMANLEISIEAQIAELMLVRETVFPALEQDVVARFPLSR